MGVSDLAFCSTTGWTGLTGWSEQSNRSAVPVRPVGKGGPTDFAGWSADLTRHTLLWGMMDLHLLNCLAFTFSASWLFFSWHRRRCSFLFWVRVNPDGHHLDWKYFDVVVLPLLVSWSSTMIGLWTEISTDLWRTIGLVPTSLTATLISPICTTTSVLIFSKSTVDYTSFLFSLTWYNYLGEQNWPGPWWY